MNMVNFHKCQQIYSKSLPVDFAAIIKFSGQSQGRKPISHQRLAVSRQITASSTAPAHPIGGKQRLRIFVYISLCYSPSY
jgi:hypothetical protein